MITREFKKISKLINFDGDLKQMDKKLIQQRCRMSLYTAAVRHLGNQGPL